jgi:hypothetical protein
MRTGTAIAHIPSVIQVPLIGQGVFMIRILLVLVTLGLFSAAIGCRAEGEIDTTSSVSLAR